MNQLTTINNTEKLLKPEAAADFLCISLRTLEGWRQRGGGPKYLSYSSRCIRYRLSDLEDWKNGKVRNSTSSNKKIAKINHNKISGESHV